MAVRHPHGETVVIHPYLEDGGRDDYNNPVPGWGEEEDQGGHNRTVIVEGYDVYDTFDSPVGPYDEVTARGVRYAVDGQVARWRNPFTAGPSGCMFKLKRVEG